MFEETKHTDKAKSRRIYAIRLGQERNNFRIGHRVAWERRIVVRQEAEFDVANACRAPAENTPLSFRFFFSFYRNVSGEKAENTPDETNTWSSSARKERWGKGAEGEEKGRSSESKVETWLMRRILP